MTNMELPRTVTRADMIEAFEKLLPGFAADQVFEVAIGRPDPTRDGELDYPRIKADPLFIEVNYYRLNKDGHKYLNASGEPVRDTLMVKVV